MMIKRWWVLGAGVLLLSACSSSEPAENSTPSPSVTSLAGCYNATVGNDRAYLKLEQDGTRVKGVLEYAFTQKDTSWGLVEGSVTATTIELQYEYLSEGLISIRTLTLQRDGEKLSGEGWSYSPTNSCGTGAGWSDAEVSNVVADTFHDPETGYYARARFNIAGPADGYTYRCIATVTDANGSEIVSWVSSAATAKSTALKKQGMQANIKPEQVDQVSAANVVCQVRGAA